MFNSRKLFGSFLSYKFFFTFVLLTTDINLNSLLKAIFDFALFIFSFILILYFSKRENNSSKIYFLLSMSQEATSIIFVKLPNESMAIFTLLQKI